VKYKSKTNAMQRDKIRSKERTGRGRKVTIPAARAQREEESSKIHYGAHAQKKKRTVFGFPNKQPEAQ
jgi:hypothetical protein